MANVVERSELPDRGISIPGLKPPAWDFGPGDAGDPTEVDRFNAIIRALRSQAPVGAPDR
jgi:hypothetical protein